MQARPWAILFVGLVALFVGCDNRPYRAAVSGQVLIDGQPLEYGTIRLIPMNARPAFGRLDEQGRFKLTTWDNDDGVVPGECIVLVSAGKSLSATSMQWYAPQQYAHMPRNETEMSEALRVNIDGPTEGLIIELTWDVDPRNNGPYIDRSSPVDIEE